MHYSDPLERKLLLLARVPNDAAETEATKRQRFSILGKINWLLDRLLGPAKGLDHEAFARENQYKAACKSEPAATEKISALGVEMLDAHARR